MLTRRSKKLEWMDLGQEAYTPDLYRDCLFKLDRIGRFLGGDRATFHALKNLPEAPTSILDVGCGGGLFTMRLATHYPQAKIVGSDISHEAITFATAHLKTHFSSLSNIEFIKPDIPMLDSTFEFDVVMSTLVCHHLCDDSLISFIQQSCRIAKKAVILNDLHRHPLASLGFAALVPFLFPNRMIWHDGLLSIRRAFTKREWKRLLKAAGINENDYTLIWHWPFRWIVKIETEKFRDA